MTEAEDMVEYVRRKVIDEQRIHKQYDKKLACLEKRIEELVRILKIVKYGAEMIGPEPYEFTANEVSELIDEAIT